MKVYFHKIYTEAHRRWRRGVAFANALEAAGAEVSMVLDSSCDMALCGAFCLEREFDSVVYRHREFLHEGGKPPIKVVHMCWDLYQIHVEGTRSGMAHDERVLWGRYRTNLRKADLVVTPTQSSARRIESYVDCRIAVVPPACDPWWTTVKNAPVGGHVLDVMRPYDDWGQGRVREACESLGLPCVESRGSLSFDDFKAAVVNARVLVCAYDEASTGGLTLLEGAAIGKRVVASDSCWNGAADLFGPRATYFKRGDARSLAEEISRSWQAGPVVQADWVRGNFSDEAMAAVLVEKMRAIL